jgi:hypothetical protein
LVEEVREAWTRQQRRSRQSRSMVPTTVPGRGGEGWAEGAVPGHINVEEERGTGVEEQRGIGMEAHAEDMRRVCGGGGRGGGAGVGGCVAGK